MEESKTKDIIHGGLYEEKINDLKEHYALIDFETTVYSYLGSKLIGSKLDFDANGKQCRIAFEGEILRILSKEQRAAFAIKRMKERIGKIEKVLDPTTLLIKDLFKKETNVSLFIGKKIEIKALSKFGILSSTFGKSGKVKVTLNEEVPKDATESLINTEVVMVIEKELFKSKKPEKH